MIWSTCLLVIVMTGAKADGGSERTFETVGQFIGRGGVFNQLLGPGPNGEQWLYVTYTYTQGGMHLVAFDPRTGKHRVFENPQGGAWALEVGPDNRIYAGTFYNGHILRFDPKTGKLDDLGQAIAGESYILSLSRGRDGKLYGGTYPGAKLVQFDPATGKSKDLGRMDPVEHYNRHTVAGSDGWVYCGIGTARANLVAYNPSTNEKRSLIPEDRRDVGTGYVTLGQDGGVYGACLGRHFRLKDGRASPVEAKDVPPAKSRVRLEDGGVAKPSDSYRGKELPLFRVAAGPDGKVYASSVLPEYLLRYDPGTGRCENLGLIPGAEAYSLLAHAGKLYIASYTGATLQAYDPAKPFDPGKEVTNNPAFYGSVAPRQDRPYDMVVGTDGRIYVACVPTYGRHGGALAWFDPRTGKLDHVFAPIQDQAVTALCALEGDVLAVGTGIAGGPGTKPKAEQAELFIWDTKKGQVAFRCVPVPGAAEISNSACGGGLIYGTAGGTMFVFDPARKVTVATDEIPYGPAVRAGLIVAPGGRIVGLAGPCAYTVRLSNDRLEFELLARHKHPLSVGKAVVGKYLYAASGAFLVRCRL